ncbi:MAG TPA: Hsp70 family protein [Polyangia bacterium]|jgi:actin-like ATPase involved in cell morphogenesis
MSDEHDKLNRQHPRFDVDWRVKLRCPDWKSAQRVAAANVSRGGLFISTHKPPTIGSQVEVLVELPDGTALLLRGACVHIRSQEQALKDGRSPGFGLKIDDTHATDLMLLEEVARASVAPVEPGAAAAPPAPPPRPAATAAPLGRVQVTERYSPRAEAARDESAAPDAAAAAARRPTLSPLAPQEPVAPAPPAGPTITPLPRARPPLFAAPAPAPAPAAPAAPAPAAPAPAVAPALAVAAAPAAVPAAAAAPAAARRATPARPPQRAAEVLIRGAAEAVGIDFGTTYTRIAVHAEGGVQLLSDIEGRTVFPSVISYPEVGGAIVGWPARDRLALDPARTVASAKRLLGRKHDHPEIQGLVASSAFPTERGPGDQVLLRIGDQTLAIPQVCGGILRHACELGERQLGVRIRKVVLSIPVTFGPEQITALKRSALLAGLEIIGLVEEPVAGALTYGFGQGRNEVVAVYDFGGGTFDCTIMDVSRNAFRVLASSGDAWLGGDDFDLALAQWAADRFWRETKVELRQRVVEWQRLLLAAEEAKRRLSDAPATAIEVPQATLAPQVIDLHIPIDRHTLEELCRDLVTRSLEVCQEALAAAGLDGRDVGQVVLTGGVTHMPLVHAAVERFFEREVTSVVAPDVAVAQGAAIHAARVTGRAPTE